MSTVWHDTPDIDVDAQPLENDPDFMTYEEALAQDIERDQQFLSDRRAAKSLKGGPGSGRYPKGSGNTAVSGAPTEVQAGRTNEGEAGAARLRTAMRKDLK